MRRQSLIALGVAIVLGLLAVYLANAFLGGRKDQDPGTTRVAVAAVPLAYGTELSADKVKFVAYPANAIPPGSFTKPADLLRHKRAVLTNIAINEPILASKVSGPGQNASIAALLPDGKRAAAVRINDVSGVAGFVQPNDSVDVLVTRQVPGSERDLQVTDVLLQNARVIAIDQVLDANGKPTVAKTATLEVFPVDAQKLALAQEVGSLSLVLRKPGEEQNNPLVQTVSLGDLRYNRYGTATYNGPVTVPAQTQVRRPAAAPARRAPAPRQSTARPAAPPPANSNVEVVRGTQGNQYEVGPYGR